MSTSKWGSGGTGWIEQYDEAQNIKRDGTFNGEVVTLTTSSDGMVVPVFTERVKAGMDLLDKINPGWQEELNLSTLDLEDDQRCVLGQSWPLYAKAHGLIERAEGGDFKEFADTVFNLNPEAETTAERIDFAAAIGCALSEADFYLLNGEAVAWACEKYGLTRDQFKTAGHIIKVDCKEHSAKTLNRYWEELTATWVAEILKAKSDGRWAQEEAVSTA